MYKKINLKVLLAFIMGGIGGYGVTPYIKSFQNPADSVSTQIQVRFSPGGHCTEFAIQAIQAAQKSILVHAYAFTSPDISDALVDMYKKGIKVQILVDHSQLTARSSQVPKVFHAGVPISIDKVTGIAHNKVMIIDDEYVLTGSFNWTLAAETRNAENLLLIKDKDINSIYRQNWKQRAEHAKPVKADDIRQNVADK